MTRPTPHDNDTSQSPVVGNELAQPILPGDGTHLKLLISLEIVKIIDKILTIPQHLHFRITETAPQPHHGPVLSYWLVETLLCLVLRSEATATILSCTLIILERLQDKPSIFTRGSLGTKIGLLLAVFIVASNYITGTRCSPDTWSSHVDGLFDPSEIAWMEIEVISLLDYHIRISDISLHERIASILTTAQSNSNQETVKNQRRRMPPLIPASPPVPAHGPFPRRRTQSAPSRFVKHKLEWVTDRNRKELPDDESRSQWSVRRWQSVHGDQALGSFSSSS